MAFALMDVKRFTLPVLVFGIMPALPVRNADDASKNGGLGAVCGAPEAFFAGWIYRGSSPPAAGYPAGEGPRSSGTFWPASGETQSRGRSRRAYLPFCRRGIFARSGASVSVSGRGLGSIPTKRPPRFRPRGCKPAHRECGALSDSRFVDYFGPLEQPGSLAAADVPGHRLSRADEVREAVYRLHFL